MQSRIEIELPLQGAKMKRKSIPMALPWAELNWAFSPGLALRLVLISTLIYLSTYCINL